MHTACAKKPSHPTYMLLGAMAIISGCIIGMQRRLTGDVHVSIPATGMPSAGMFGGAQGLCAHQVFMVDTLIMLGNSDMSCTMSA